MINLLKLKNNFPPLEGAQVRLQLFDESHITDSYLAWLNDPVVVRYSNQRFIEHTFDTSAKYLASFVGTENILLAVYLKETGRYVGTMNVYFSAIEQAADIGILVGDKSCWGRGVGEDAWMTVVSWLLDFVMVAKVVSGTLRCNKAMVSIMFKSGMVLTSAGLEYELIEGQSVDVVYFEKVNTSGN